MIRNGMGLAVAIVLGASAAGAAADPPFYEDKQDLLYYLDGRGERRPVRSKSDWARRRRHIIANMELVMGALPRIDHKLPLAVEVLKEASTPKYAWRRITYVAERGDRVPAYVYIPHGLAPNRRTPAVVSLHGTSYRRYVPHGEAALGPGDQSGDAQYAQELAERGFVVIAPDYVLLTPDYKTDPYALGYVSGTMKAIVNHIRAVDVLASMREVDPKRIGALGLSLGGHNSLFLAVFEPRIRAVVSSAGFNTFRKYYGGKLKGWTSNRYMPRIATEYGSQPERVPFDFTEVLAAIAPRPVFVNAPLGDDNFEVSGVRDCVDAAMPVYREIFGAGDRLIAQYAEGGHGFSSEARQAAYALLERWLKR
jgi:dienelactone hydrolase